MIFDIDTRKQLISCILSDKQHLSCKFNLKNKRQEKRGRKTYAMVNKPPHSSYSTDSTYTLNNLNYR